MSWNSIDGLPLQYNNPSRILFRIIFRPLLRSAATFNIFPNNAGDLLQLEFNVELLHLICKALNRSAPSCLSHFQLSIPLTRHQTGLYDQFLLVSCLYHPSGKRISCNFMHWPFGWTPKECVLALLFSFRTRKLLNSSHRCLWGNFIYFNAKLTRSCLNPSATTQSYI